MADKQLINTTGMAGWQAVEFALTGGKNDGGLSSNRLYKFQLLVFLLNSHLFFLTFFILKIPCYCCVIR